MDQETRKAIEAIVESRIASSSQSVKLSAQRESVKARDTNFFFEYEELSKAIASLEGEIKNLNCKIEPALTNRISAQGIAAAVPDEGDSVLVKAMNAQTSKVLALSDWVRAISERLQIQ